MVARNRGNRQLLTVLVAVVLASVLRLNGIAERAARVDANGATPAADLSVSSDPSGAQVYVDGRLAGRTPLGILRLAPGGHRVRLVKDGYLENSRIMTVSAHGSNKMHVALTPDRSADLGGAAQASGGSATKWIWIAAAGGAAAAAVAFGPRNHAPDAGSVIVTPTAVGMAGLTSFSFDSTASDKDGDPLAYNWDFGDGATGTGKTQTHIYSATGTFRVTLRVSDGKSVSAEGVSVTVARDVAGTWTSPSTLPSFFPCAISFTAAQNGGVLTGSFRFMPGDAMGCSRPPVALSSGSVSPLTHPSTVTWASDTFAFAFIPSPVVIEDLSLRFTGTTNTAADRLTGSLQVVRAGLVLTTLPVTFTR